MKERGREGEEGESERGRGRRDERQSVGGESEDGGSGRGKETGREWESSGTCIDRTLP